MASGIYKITDLKNNKIYIGRAVNLKNRKWRHYCYTHPEDYLESSLASEINMNIHQAMMKSKNANNFIFEVLEECEEDLLDEKEQYYIKKFDCIEPKGYNKTKGGNTYPHVKGEQHYNHKITEEEASKIKTLLSQQKSVDDIIMEIPNATIGIVSHINNGRAWKDNNINYPICRLSGLIRFDDEMVMEIRRRREEGESTVKLAQDFGTGTSTISSICNGDTHKNLPVLRQNIATRNLFNEEQVNYFRKQHYIQGIPIKTLYENSKFTTQISYDGFKKMVNGSSYKEYKIYNKEIKADKLKNRNEQIRQLVIEGLTKKEIAKIVGCSERTIYRAINKENKFE